jgi:Domain of unknown function (DUF4082)
MSFVLHALRSRASRAGLALAAAVTLAATSAAIWTATTANAAPPDTIWGTQAPTSAAVDPDTGAVELGTSFTAVTSGQATGIRFYKAPENRGTHTGSLWTSSGTLLGRVTFAAETSSGWQTAALSSPVTLTAGGSYVVSYHTNVGRYVATERFTGTSASPNLRIPTSNVGVYTYGTNSAFPKESWNASQYWVDLTFTTNRPATTTTGTPLATPTTTPTPAPSSTTSYTTTPTAATTTPTAATTTPTAATTTPTTTTTTSTPSVTALGSRSTPTSKTTKASSSSSTGSTASSPTASSSTSSGMTNCVNLPSRCGYPDATNTGVPAGSAMRRVPQDVTSGPGWVWDSRGWLQTSSGAVVKNLIVSGPVNVAGANVTVQNTQILVDGETWGIGLQHATNALITDNEIGILGSNPRLLVGIKDVYGDCTGTQILRNNVQNTSTGIQVHEGLIADNYVHDIGFSTGDHLNGTTSNGATTMMTIRHNTILNQYGQTDAISLFQDFGVEANRVVTDNLLAGGGYTIYGGGGSQGKSSNITITNNRFSTIFYPNGGSYGPMTAFDNTGTGNSLSGNYWDSNLAPVNM